MLKKSFYILILLATVFNQSFANSGVQISASRLIYNENDTQATVNVINSDNSPHLIQSWVTNVGEEQTRQDNLFITTPPLFRLDVDTTNPVRVMVIDEVNLPKDRESVFWLNIKAIPSVEKTNNNKLIIAIKSQIKLFYHPLNLNAKASDAYKSIHFIMENNQLMINNPTPFNISFHTIKINNTELNDTIMISPFSRQSLNIKAKAGQAVTWNAINDYGGITPAITMRITDQ